MLPQTTTVQVHRVLSPLKAAQPLALREVDLPAVPPCFMPAALPTCEPFELTMRAAAPPAPQRSTPLIAISPELYRIRQKEEARRLEEEAKRIAEEQRRAIVPCE